MSSSHLSLIFLLPLKTSAFTSTRMPGSSSLCLSFCHSTVSVCVLPPLIELVSPAGWSSIYPKQKPCTHPHAWQRPLLWGPCCCQWWGRKVDWEPMSKHQVLWTLPGYCRMGGIIGVCHFSQMRWPVSFLIFSQLPNDVYNHLVQSLYQAIGLWVVGHCPVI